MKQWFQCKELPNFYSQNGHVSYLDEGVCEIEGIIRDRANEGSQLILQTGEILEILDGMVVPPESE